MLYVAARITAISHECGNAACPEGAAPAAPLGAPRTDELDELPHPRGDAPALLAGMFLGVPLLAREHEQRTLVLAWSQDITPQRWLWTSSPSSAR